MFATGTWGLPAPFQTAQGFRRGIEGPHTDRSFTELPGREADEPVANLVGDQMAKLSARIPEGHGEGRVCESV